MDIFGYFSVLMGIYGYFWVIMGIYGYLWVLMGTNGYLKKNSFHKVGVKSCRIAGLQEDPDLRDPWY